MIRRYQSSDAAALLAVWNTAGVRDGFAPLEEEDFHRLLLNNPDFSPEYTFVLEERGELLGFCNGCTGDHLPRGAQRGYLSCVLLSDRANTPENTSALLAALEAAFRESGRTGVMVNCFNPIRLPWVIPGTGGHQHNNAPGIALDTPLYGRMLALGYREAARERAMYLDLSGYEGAPDWIEEKAEQMAQKGLTVAPYDPACHTGLQEMVDAIGNPVWSVEIPQAGGTGMDLLVALQGNTCAGFTGPVYPEKTGRGYFSGIGVAPQYEKQGFGTLLFYRLLDREKRAGARYMSLFTGEQNRAGNIYLGAGFRVVRRFAVMTKEL